MPEGKIEQGDYIWRTICLRTHHLFSPYKILNNLVVLYRSVVFFTGGNYCSSFVPSLCKCETISRVVQTLVLKEGLLVLEYINMMHCKSYQKLIWGHAVA
jgi:hypothetical protein